MSAHSTVYGAASAVDVQAGTRTAIVQTYEGDEFKPAHLTASQCEQLAANLLAAAREIRAAQAATVCAVLP